jgi:hypothetical protein
VTDPLIVRFTSTVWGDMAWSFTHEHESGWLLYGHLRDPDQLTITHTAPARSRDWRGSTDSVELDIDYGIDIERRLANDDAWLVGSLHTHADEEPLVLSDADYDTTRAIARRLNGLFTQVVVGTGTGVEPYAKPQVLALVADNATGNTRVASVIIETKED